MNNLSSYNTETVMNTYARLPIAIERGEGSYLIDTEGNRYLDFTSGVAVNSLGHQHPKVTQAIMDQVQKILHCSNLYHIPNQIKLSEMLVENSCFDQVFYCNSGAEANEAAIKLARRYAQTVVDSNRYEVLSLVNSFHGRTLATLAATAQTKYQAGFAPMPVGFRHVEADIDRIAAEISDVTCAIILEPVQGEGGIIPFEPEFLQALRQLCDDKNLLLIFDEIQCGMGRTGRLFAYQNSGVEPDIMTLAKSLGSGVPIGAMLAKRPVSEAFQPGAHASTFGGNPLATAAAVATVQTILEEQLPQRAEHMGDYLRQSLAALITEFPGVKSVRGLGLMLGLQVTYPLREVVESCQQQGLLIAVAGVDTLRFLPPLTVTEAEIDQAVQILRTAIAQQETADVLAADRL